MSKKLYDAVAPGDLQVEHGKFGGTKVKHRRLAYVHELHGVFSSVTPSRPGFFSLGLFVAKPLGDQMIKVLASKVFPSKATLTKFEYVKDDNKIVFYVRENVRITAGGPTQVLEVCAPADKLTEVVAIVELEDSVKRKAYPAEDFTEAWAEGHLFVPTINCMPKEPKESP